LKIAPTFRRIRLAVLYLGPYKNTEDNAAIGVVIALLTALAVRRVDE